jgi:hypothetical protein
VRSPVTHHEHLHGRGSISGDREERSGERSEIALLVAGTEVNLAAVEGYSFVNRNAARGLPLNFEGLWRQVLSAVKCCRERNRRAPVGELEVDFHRNRIAVAPDFVRLLPNRLLEFVQGKFALLDEGGRFASGGLLRRRARRWDRRRNSTRKDSE